MVTVRNLLFVYVFVILLVYNYALFFFFFKQKTAYEMRISDWSSDVCSSRSRPYPCFIHVCQRLLDAPRIGGEGAVGRRIRHELGKFGRTVMMVDIDAATCGVC